MPDASRVAAFFDVDGTLAATNIALPYVYLRRRLLPRWRYGPWLAGFLLRIPYFYCLDQIDRSAFNRAFYRQYRGLEAEMARSLAEPCAAEVYRPALYTGARQAVQEHLARGDQVVIVSGALDFLLEPLARLLGATAALGARLGTSDGRFTGELQGPPVAAGEKRRLVEEYATRHGIDLPRSWAYGDSLADLAMLEVVGRPVAVNPSSGLRRVALARGWEMRFWRKGPAA